MADIRFIKFKDNCLKVFAVVQKTDLSVGIATVVAGLSIGDKTVRARHEAGR